MSGSTRLQLSVLDQRGSDARAAAVRKSLSHGDTAEQQATANDNPNAARVV